jgi:hypothetical protein
MSFKKKDAPQPVGKQQAQSLTHLHQNNKREINLQTIHIPNVELVTVADLKTDNQNPNRMTRTTR